MKRRRLYREACHRGCREACSMARFGARFGRDSGGLLRDAVPVGKVELKEMVELGEAGAAK